MIVKAAILNQTASIGLNQESYGDPFFFINYRAILILKSSGVKKVLVLIFNIFVWIFHRARDYSSTFSIAVIINVISIQTQPIKCILPLFRHHRYFHMKD